MTKSYSTFDYKIMANYLFAIAEPTKIDKIITLFQSNEVIRRKLSDNHDYIYVSKNINDEIYQDQSIFKGYAIDYRNNKLYFNGGSQAPDSLWPLEGCYLQAKIDLDKSEMAISNDAFAQLPIVFSQDQDSYIISDSFFIISKLREKLNLKNNINEEVAIARSWLNSITAQQVSQETIIQNIYYCPPGNRLVIKSSKQSLHSQTNKLHLPELFSLDIQSYSEAIRKGAEQLASALLTYSHIKNAQTNLSISGGLDSRVCLAAALISGNKDQFRVTSSQLWPVDYAIASSLGEKFGFSLTTPASLPTSKIDSFSSWMISSCGIYDPFYTAKNVALSPNFGIGGHGAETLKGNYGWRPIKDITSKNNSSLVNDAFQSQAKKGLLSIGVPHDDPWGSEWHYIGYRNAIHAGRSTMTSLLSCRPILQQQLIGLSRIPSSKNLTEKTPNSIVSDLLIALHPKLASMPFDNPAKNMDEDFVKERHKYLKVDPQNIQPLDIIGSPENVSKGPPESFLQIAKDNGFSGGLPEEKIKAYCINGYEKLPSNLHSLYSIHAAESQKYTKTEKAASPIGMSVGKLLTLNLLTS